MPRALITGITGQDGSYLSELLFNKGYEVFGVERRVALEDQSLRNKRIDFRCVKDIVSADISNFGSVFHAIQKIKPDEIYHLAAQSDVAESFRDPFQTHQINTLGTLNVLEAMRVLVPNSRFYFAGSSEMFGQVEEEPQCETTRFHPRSPYGVSKVAGFYQTQNYREMGHFCCSGILFNHESPRRGKEFVTRKITSAVAQISTGKDVLIQLGNLDSMRDWGFAGDYVKVMNLMLQQKVPQDYVIGTGEKHSVREFAELAFQYAYMDLHWEGKGLEEIGVASGKKVIEISKKFFRPSDVNTLLADSSKAKVELGWEPEIKFRELVQMMVKGDLEIYSK